MEEQEQRLMHPELKALAADASKALARLDGPRLREMALSCQALNQSLPSMSGELRDEMARQSREAAADMAVFARVLDATRANLGVMNRLRDLRIGPLEYTEQQARGGEATEPAACDETVLSPSTDSGRRGAVAEDSHGDD
jgi:hypothetical protein